MKPALYDDYFPFMKINRLWTNGYANFCFYLWIDTKSHLQTVYNTDFKGSGKIQKLKVDFFCPSGSCYNYPWSSFWSIQSACRQRAT